MHDLLADGQLRRVLPDWHGEPQQLHLLYPRRRYQPARAFIEFIAARLAALPGLETSIRL